MLFRNSFKFNGSPATTTTPVHFNLMQSAHCQHIWSCFSSRFLVFIYPSHPNHCLWFNQSLRASSPANSWDGFVQHRCCCFSHFSLFAHHLLIIHAKKKEKSTPPLNEHLRPCPKIDTLAPVKTTHYRAIGEGRQNRGGAETGRTHCFHVRFAMLQLN